MGCAYGTEWYKVVVYIVLWQCVACMSECGGVWHVSVWRVAVVCSMAAAVICVLPHLKRIMSANNTKYMPDR